MEFNHRLACVYTPFVKRYQTESFKNHAVLLSVGALPVVRYLLALPVFSLPPVGFYANCTLWFSKLWRSWRANMNKNMFDSERVKNSCISFKRVAFKKIIIVFKNHTLQIFSQIQGSLVFVACVVCFHEASYSDRALLHIWRTLMSREGCQDAIRP